MELINEEFNLMEERQYLSAPLLTSIFYCYCYQVRALHLRDLLVYLRDLTHAEKVDP